MNKQIIIGLAVLGLVVLGISLKDGRLGGGRGETATSCTISTVTPALVGASNSSTLLAAHSNRAWARITQNSGTDGIATSTLFVMFNDGGVAKLNSGVQLGTSTPSIDFGRNTDFPYTGAVTGITSTGSTTVMVTECRY